MKIIGDPGSCHLGDLQKAKDLISIGSACGLDGVKFQLLTDNEARGGNILLPWGWMPELIAFGNQKGVEVFASVFDGAGILKMEQWNCKSIKFSYGRRQAAVIRDFENVYVSCDVMDSHYEGAINLYCIPEYPVRYQIDFEGIFPRFDGFSDHTLGFRQTIRAAECGAQYIEKHFQGNWDSDCPDGRFALKPKQLDEMVKQLKR